LIQASTVFIQNFVVDVHKLNAILEYEVIKRLLKL